ncbi:mavicyanin [Phtheirospermum japonicum]|uniref:Mavicyanin n=1 Tax=Phtheirospermum japonicum TaxID=374723 RepID=A0A830B815_9LAMI|nr:mavicyanin [Phtheirospermum japonicum]
MNLQYGAVHTVGDTAGWTIIGTVDYKNWAVTKTFHVGDTIVFNYKRELHNVIRVTHAEYKSCNVSSPISTHNSGNDSITIDTVGHHFFVCGMPGHCEAGQKVDINVPRGPSVVPSPLGSPPPSPVAIPAPSPSSAPSMAFQNLGWIVLLLQLLHVFGLA